MRLIGLLGLFSVKRVARFSSSMLNMSRARVLSASDMDTLIERVQENNLVRLTDLEAVGGKYTPFVVDERVYGYCQADFVRRLRSFPTALSVEECCITFAAEVPGTTEARTEAMAGVTSALRADGTITGWRDELLPVVEAFSSEPVFLIERAAYAHFGTKGYGVHVNGYVVDTATAADSTTGAVMPKLWVAKRAATKQTWPGMLDHIVAGGQPHGISPTANVMKECGEEASIPPALAANACSAAGVSYMGVDEQGNLKRDVLFCFDLELPPSFVPRSDRCRPEKCQPLNNLAYTLRSHPIFSPTPPTSFLLSFSPSPADGEVESFQLQDLNWCLNRVLEGGPGGYKPNCILVVLDFMLRRGFISSDSPRYLQLVGLLRQPGCA